MPQHLFFFPKLVAGERAHASTGMDDDLLDTSWDDNYAVCYLIVDGDDMRFHPTSPAPIDNPDGQFAYCTGPLCVVEDEPNLFFTAGEPLVMCNACAEHITDPDNEPPETDGAPHKHDE